MRTAVELREGIQPVVRTTQLIVFAFCMGLTTFSGMTVYFKLSKPEQPRDNVGAQADEPPESRKYLFAYMAVAFALTAAPFGFIMSGATVRSGRRKIAINPDSFVAQGMPESVQALGDAGKLAMLYQTKTIILGAFVEGPGFFGAIAALMEGLPALLIPAASLVVLACLFPNVERVAVWIEGQLRLLEDERSMGRV